MILRKIIKIAATRCHILKLKCTKFDFGWGSAPDPAGESLQRSPDPLAGFKGPTSKGTGEDGKGGEGRGGEDKGGQWNGTGRERGREGGKVKGSEGIGEGDGGEGEWGSPTHYFRLKSCTGICLLLLFCSLQQEQ